MSITSAAAAKKLLMSYAETEKVALFQRFFKTAKGQYGYGDKFIGVTVPNNRKAAKECKNLALSEVLKLLRSPIHEERLLALIILTSQFKNTPEEVFEFYWQHRKYVNNWDLVDLSAPPIVGAHFSNRSRKTLAALIKSPELWERRIAMVSTLYFIRQNDLDDTYSFAKQLLKDEQDLMHKAAGWMLREAGKRDVKRLAEFVNKHKTTMPRTMLRYAIEKFSESERKGFMK